MSDFNLLEDRQTPARSTAISDILNEPNVKTRGLEGAVTDTIGTQATPEYVENYDSIGYKNIINFPLEARYHEEQKDIKPNRMIRTEYTEKIVTSLKWLIENHESNNQSIPYMNKLQKAIIRFIDSHFEDPFSSFLTALYDGLINENIWICLSKESYKTILDILVKLNNDPKIDYDKVDKCIVELEKLGLETTPY